VPSSFGSSAKFATVTPSSHSCSCNQLLNFRANLFHLRTSLLSAGNARAAGFVMAVPPWTPSSPPPWPGQLWPSPFLLVLAFCPTEPPVLLRLLAGRLPCRSRQATAAAWTATPEAAAVCGQCATGHLRPHRRLPWVRTGTLVLALLSSTTADHPQASSASSGHLLCSLCDGGEEGHRA
jgi:hypothetical protein